jgi:predicted DNA-binding transcriptional regulator YafY
MGRASPPGRRDRQVVRVLGILKLLGEGARPHVTELAARFKTRRETIYRDLRAIQDVGYPLTGDDGGHLSRPRLPPEARSGIPPVLLTRRELAALVWAVKQGQGKQPFRADLSTALPKLQALAARRDSSTTLALDGTVGGWQRGVKDYAGSEPTILRLVEGIVSRRRCLVEYRAPWQAAPKRFPYEPYRLLSVHGGVYCVGKVPAYRNLVTLAVDRIRAIELTDEPFVPDAGFDPKRHEAEAFGIVWERPMRVVLRFRADQAPYVREREWHPTQRFRTLRDGRLEMRLHAGGTLEIARWILGWGDAVEVLRPAALRARVRAALRAAARPYGIDRVRLDRTRRR